MIQSVIFDVDGVIFQNQDASGNYIWSKSIRKDLRVRGFHFKKIFSPEWENVTRGKIDTLEYLKKVFKDKVFDDLNLLPEEYIDYWLKHDNHINLEMLSLVKSIRVSAHLGTNQDGYRTEHIKKVVGNTFKNCFASYVIGHIKPEAGFYQHIENKLKLEPRHILLIDDTHANVEGARRRGWQTYLYKGDLQQLKLYLQELNLIM